VSGFVFGFKLLPPYIFSDFMGFSGVFADWRYAANPQVACRRLDLPLLYHKIHHKARAKTPINKS
jgi:hypothetical protein